MLPVPETYAKTVFYHRLLVLDMRRLVLQHDLSTKAPGERPSGGRHNGAFGRNVATAQLRFVFSLHLEGARMIPENAKTWVMNRIDSAFIRFMVGEFENTKHDMDTICRSCGAAGGRYFSLGLEPC